MADDMQALSGRAEKLINALTNAILTTAEVAAEKIELASRVAQINQRMTAYAAVLEIVGAQKMALMQRRDATDGPMKALLTHQIETLTVQEIAILESSGAPAVAARTAVETIDEPVYRRDGKRFVQVEPKS